MLKSTLSKIAKIILIMTLVYTGSFMLVEEVSEKTEKSEKSEEALHSIYHSHTFKRSINQRQHSQKRVNSRISLYTISNHFDPPIDDNYNVDYIYTTSYLDSYI